MSSARFADKPDDYKKLGIQPGHIEAFEDGMRTEGGPGGYEWWYFDCHLRDGSSLVVTFYTKPQLSPDGPLAPYATLELDRPGQPPGQPIVAQGAFSARRDRCDVRIGENTFRGNLHEYDIHFSQDGVTVDIKLTGTVPTWRPTSGYIFFGNHDEHFFAWLAAVPQGEVTVDLNIQGTQEHLQGVGYHDHNWGDTSMATLINHWYWGRARAGDYSNVASHIVAEKAYGNTELPIFMLAKDGKIIAEDTSKVSFHLEDVHIDQISGKPVANVVVHEYEDGPELYRVSYRRAQTIVDADGYLRFTGNVQLERFVDGTEVEDVNDQEGIWELMYLGPVY